MQTSLTPEARERIGRRLKSANAEFAAKYPGESSARQPVHTVYGGAHLFRPETARKLGDLALRSIEVHAPEPAAFATAIGFDRALAERVYERVLAKLRSEPVEDYRIDFEDGYGHRDGAEEDRDAERTALETAKGLAAGSLAPFLGIRIKALTEELRDRAIRTLDIFLTTLAARSGTALPPNFVVTLPKVTIPEQVSALADALDVFEQHLGFASGSIGLQIMVETPQGVSRLSEMAESSRGRCRGVDFGAYDYTAACGVSSPHQHLLHPACDYARNAMQVALSGTGIRLTDGGTNLMPVPPHVHSAWKLHYAHTRHSLMSGFYSGWDLHPAQLPVRYAAVFAFFLEGMEEASRRLCGFMEKAARATVTGGIFDDAATGQGLLNFFLRAIACGALTEPEAEPLTGLTMAELRSGSFANILDGRRNQ